MPFYIYHLILFSQEPCKGNAVSTHSVDLETEDENFKMACMAQETEPTFAEHFICTELWL